ncbi:hypothetical protein MRX96_025242 [Rhipicephalus microplus]
MLPSTRPSPGNMTHFKQAPSLTRTSRPEARANTQLPALFPTDMCDFCAGQEEPVTPMTVFRNPPEPPTIPEPLDVASSTLMMPAPKQPVMTLDASRAARHPIFPKLRVSK